jgi:hypothetical protein
VRLWQDGILKYFILNFKLAISAVYGMAEKRNEVPAGCC